MLDDKELLENYGYLYNAAKYKTEIIGYILNDGMNIYQAIAQSTQTEDLSDLHNMVYMRQKDVEVAGISNMSQFIMECTYNGNNCVLDTDFYKMFSPRYGFCYTFNSGLGTLVL